MNLDEDARFEVLAEAFYRWSGGIVAPGKEWNNQHVSDEMRVAMWDQFLLRHEDACRYTMQATCAVIDQMLHADDEEPTGDKRE